MGRQVTDTTDDHASRIFPPVAISMVSSMPAHMAVAPRRATAIALMPRRFIFAIMATQQILLASTVRTMGSPTRKNQDLMGSRRSNVSTKRAVAKAITPPAAHGCLLPASGTLNRMYR